MQQVRIEYNDYLSTEEAYEVADVLEDEFDLGFKGGEPKPNHLESCTEYVARLRNTIDRTIGRHVGVSIDVADEPTIGMWDDGEYLVSANREINRRPYVFDFTSSDIDYIHQASLDTDKDS